ncbi:MAG: outer membrane beta-barrel protein, partial [Prevotellaceae bacterium]|nr:outer membrane beta-barrel protein [Prevotellaceae bacterium]
MKKFLAGAVLLLLTAFPALSQNRYASVSGRVVDENKEGVPQATIQLLSLPDSTYVTGIATSTQGYFRLARISLGNYVLKVSYIGYKNQFIPLQLTASTGEKKVGTLTLKTDAIMLAEAVVTAEAPQVQVEEDTIAFNSSAYRTPEGAMLEELVKKLPGAEVDDDGNVKINGKDISKIMVNGKEFFGGDVSTGMKNLPVDMIEKLKTYDKKSDLARITGIDDGEEETVLDLTVKKGMDQGVFGNIDLSYGTRKRYNEHAMFNYFRGKTQVSLIGGANNVNDKGFSGGGGGPRFNQNNGMTTVRRVGLNFASENDKLDIGGSARVDYRKNNQISTGYAENFLTNSATSSFSNSNSNSLSRDLNFNMDFRMEWRPDTLTNIIFRPNFSYGKSKSDSDSQSGTFSSDPYELIANPNDYLDLDALTGTVDPLDTIRVNTSNNLSTSKGNQLSTDATLQINRKLNSLGRNITFRGMFNYGNNDNDQYSSSDTKYFSSDTDDDNIRRYITSPSKNYSLAGQLTYSEPIARATYLQFSYQFTYSHSQSDKNTYDLSNPDDYSGEDDYWTFGGELPADYKDHRDADNSKFAEYKTYEHDARIGFRLIRSKYQLNAGFSFQPQHTELTYQKGSVDTLTTRDVFNFSPSLDLRIRFSKVSQLRATYRGSSSQPSMENLLPVTDDSNPLNITTGNPGLKPSFTHNLRIFYNTYNADHQRGIFTHVNWQMTQNSISNV